MLQNTKLTSKVTLPFGKLQPLIDWCDRNCSSEWHYMEDPHDQYNGWVFIFEDQRDYVAFTLFIK
jgi:hypothetical protein